MERTQVWTLRHVAVAAALSNLAVIATLAALLPRELQVLLPLLGLVLPLLTAAGLEPHATTSQPPQ